jgi:hypothetical protein
MSEMEKERQQSGRVGKLTEVLGQAAPYALIPGGGATALARAGVGAATGAAAGFLSPTKSDESPIKNAAVGGLVGAAIPGAIDAAKAGAQKLAPKVYESVVKPSTTIPAAERSALAQTGIEGGYAGTEGGLKKLQKDIDVLNREIDSSITRAGKSGSDIDMKDVVKRAEDLKAFYAKLPPDRAKPFIDEIEKIQQQYLSKPKINPQEAQEMKKAIYRLHRKHYGEMKGAEVEAEKQIARGLKEEIVSRFPELKKLNAQDSSLIDLERVLGRTVNRSRNRDVVGLSDLVGGSIMGGAGLYEGGKEYGEGGAIAGILLTRALRSPAVMSRISFALNKAGKIKSNASPVVSAAAAQRATQPPPQPLQTADEVPAQ